MREIPDIDSDSRLPVDVYEPYFGIPQLQQQPL